MFSAEFAVIGMTCGHCAAAVTEQLEVLPGVREVFVDLPGGRVSLVADRPVDVRTVEFAVTYAGYRLADGVPR